MSIRIATWNLWWRFGDWRARQDAIRATLARTRPDVIGLQEVWSDDSRSLAHHLADSLGMHVWWSAAPSARSWTRRLPGSDRIGVGNAVLSRHPGSMVTVESLDAGGSDDESRVAMLVMISTPAGGLPVCCTHLSSTINASLTRQQQVRQLATLAARHRPPGPMPFVLLGDFNADPDSDEIRMLGGTKCAPAHREQVFVDAWRYREDGATGNTWVRDNPHVRATGEPSARVDYVLLGPPTAPRMATVERVEVFGDKPVAGVWPSDHAGVLVDLLAERSPEERP